MTHLTSILAPFALRRGAPVLLDSEFDRIVTGRSYDGRWHITQAGGSFEPERLALDCLDPLGRACLRMALAEGERCPCALRQRTNLCGGTGERVDPLAHDGFSGLCPGCDACREDGPCATCRGTGWLRPPAPHHWIGTTNEGGALTPAHAEAAGMSLDELAGALLVRCAGGGPLAGLLAPWNIYRHEPWEAATRAVLIGNVQIISGTERWCLYANDRSVAGGPETGRDGRLAADRAALAASLALLGDAEGRPCLLLPEVHHA